MDRTIINQNKGTLSVMLDCGTLYNYFEQTEQTVALKAALEKSIKECIATYVVDELLKCDDSVIEYFISLLNDTNQQHLAECFYKVDPESDDRYCQYTQPKHCANPIPPLNKQKLQKNYNHICELLTQCDSIATHRLHIKLVDCDAISEQCKRKINRIYFGSSIRTTKASIELLVNAILNGNAYQYGMFKKYSIKICPNVEQYL